ncbi:MAG: hypothetical protein MJK10_01190 [Pseudomonadales bacterium]|nr:hypothetical protein [Pseudomonadales bacterium]NRA14490.1 hypothetical protein [Oceanospirillaceae bacterium]
MSEPTSILITATLHVAAATVTKLMEKEIISLDDALSIFKTTSYAVEHATKDSPQQSRKLVLKLLKNQEDHCKWLALELELKNSPFH